MDRLMQKNPKVYIILLTWQRIYNLKETLERLSQQTNKNFSIRISNANLQKTHSVDKIANTFRSMKGLDIEVSHDGNDIFSFRRFTVAKELAKRDADIIMYIDDDITFDEKYVENVLSQYEPKSYCSGFTWNFQKNGQDYYKYRTKRLDNKEKIHYCGTGISVIDARVFLKKNLFEAPKEAHKIEDLWLSYYVQQVMGWKLKHIKIPNVKIGGSDHVALYKKILASDYTKADFLRSLVKDYKWKL
jgi:glycosyltransferase involved in cell wall biosynthesis